MRTVSIVSLVVAFVVIVIAVIGAGYAPSSHGPIQAAPQSVSLDKSHIDLAYQCIGTTAQINSEVDQINQSIVLPDGSFDVPTWYASPPSSPGQYILRGKIHVVAALPYSMPVYIQHLQAVAGCSVSSSVG